MNILNVDFSYHKIISKINEGVFRSQSITPLVTFRILFGLCTLISTSRFLYLGWVDLHFIDTKVTFKIYGFEWVQLPPEGWVYPMHYLMILASLGIVFGYFYRFCVAIFFLIFTYLEFVDATYYLNHYYFVSCIAFLMIFLPAHRYFSLDVVQGRVTVIESVPAWAILPIKLQLFFVYFYAGLAKINHDWLFEALPLRIWLRSNDYWPLIGPFLKYDWAAFVASWLGMLYDISIVLWLSLKKTRPIAYVAVVVFHVLTGIFFQIGVFPLVMITSTLIFFSDSWHERFNHKLKDMFQVKRRTEEVRTQFIMTPAIKYTLLVFVVFQTIFPLRFLAYPGNLFWTEQGYRFSWRVMLMEKAGTATFYVQDRRTQREGIVDNSDFLNPHQEKQMSMQPDLILQYAHFLKDYYARSGVFDPKVRAEVYVTLNGRPGKLLFDPNMDLTTLKDGWQHKSWIYHD